MTALSLLKARLLDGTAIFTIPEAKQYIADVLAFRDIDTEERFHNRFFHEFWPLVTISEAIGMPSTRIVFTASGPGVDATLMLGGGAPPRMVELTAAIDGQQEALRMEHLKKYGHAPVTGRINATGTRNRKDRHIEYAEADWQSADQYNNELFQLMKCALLAKQQKARKRPHYQDAWLGIAIPNYPPTEYKKARLDPLCAGFLHDPGSFAPFSRVFIVSTIGDYVFDSARAKSRSAMDDG